MKATKRILSGLLVLAMVLALCPFMTFAEETTDAVVSIAAFTNGTVTADKESYKIGETVTLTIAPEAGYSQKLYINGEPLLLGWKTNVYSFVATEENYAITGGFVPTFVSSTHEKWDTANNAQGVLNTYYTSGDSSWLGIDSAAESITVKVKNYQLGDGTGVDGFHVLLGFKIKGTNYTFRVIKQSGKYYCQRAGFKNAEGKDQWTKFELDAATVAAILGDGVDFKLERIAANKLAAYVNGTKYDTFEIPNATAADAVTKIYIGHAGNLNEKIAIPYTVADPIFRVTGGDWNLDNQYDGSVTILNKTKDGSTIITNASDYKGVSVTVKDYLPTYDANGAITPNGFAMQFTFIFDNGKLYQVRLHNTDTNSPNYKLQNMGGTNSLTGWKWQADLNAAQKKNLLEGDGVKITVMLEGPNAVLYADGQKKATVPLGEEYAGKLVQIQLCMNGNKTGGNIEIPFELIKASEEHIHTPATAVVENEKAPTCVEAGSYESVVYCSVCEAEISRTPVAGDPATGIHTYDNDQDADCNVCGDVREVAPSGPVVDSALNIIKHSANLESSLKLAFRLEKSVIEGANVKDYWVVFYKAEGRNEQNVTMTMTKEDIGAPATNGHYYAEYPKILACEMGVKIEAVLYIEYADGTVKCSETDSYSVLDYLNLLMTSYEPLATTVGNVYYNYMQVAVELLNYGAEAQKELKFQTDALVNANLTESQKSFMLTENPVPTNNRNWGANDGEIVFKSSTLDLQESIYSQVLIDINGLQSAQLSDLYAEVRDQETGELVETIEFAKFTVHPSYATRYYMPITAIRPANMSKVYTVQVFANGVALSSLATYSVESYVRLSMDANISASAVVMAALRYGVAAAKIS